MKVICNDGHVAECPKEEELHVIRHSAAHIMAQAVKRLFLHQGSLSIFTPHSRHQAFFG